MKIQNNIYCRLYRSLNGSYLDFLKICSIISVQQYPAWFEAYIESYLDGKNYFFLMFYDEAKVLVGVIPLQVMNKRSTRFWNRRVWTFLGNGPTDFSGPLVRPGYEAAIAKSFQDYLTAHMREWEELRLAEIPVGSVFMDEFCAGWNESEVAVSREVYSAFYEVNTTGDWDEFHETFIRPNNKDLLKDLRKLEREGVVLTIETVTTGIYERLAPVLHLYAQRRESLGQVNPYDSAARKNFVKQVTQAYEEMGKAELSFLKQGEDIWGFQLDWIDQGVRYHWNHAYNEDYKKYSPGKILLYYLLRKSFADPAIQKCNHMRGAAGYKSKLANEKTDLEFVHVINKKSIRYRAERVARKIVNVRKKLLAR